jgi:hypothetical protein
VYAVGELAGTIWAIDSVVRSACVNPPPGYVIKALDEDNTVAVAPDAANGIKQFACVVDDPVILNIVPGLVTKAVLCACVKGEVPPNVADPRGPGPLMVIPPKTCTFVKLLRVDDV